jgi:hypothetical protein
VTNTEFLGSGFTFCDGDDALSGARVARQGETPARERTGSRGAALGSIVGWEEGGAGLQAPAQVVQAPEKSQVGKGLCSMP